MGLWILRKKVKNMQKIKAICIYNAEYNQIYNLSFVKRDGTCIQFIHYDINEKDLPYKYNSLSLLQDDIIAIAKENNFIIPYHWDFGTCIYDIYYIHSLAPTSTPSRMILPCSTRKKVKK